jgi:replicative DNA helicase
MTLDALKRSVATGSGMAGDGEYRVQPHNEEVEQALLGALLVNNRALEKVSEFLRPEHFYNPVHGRIFEAITKFVERGQDASPITLKNFFEKDQDLAHVGGGQYLSDLASHVISVVNVEDYGRVVYELHLRRALISLGEDVVNDAYDHDVDQNAQDQIEQTEKRLFDLATAGDYKGGFVSFNESLTRAIQQAEIAYQREGLVTGVTTGLTDIDKKLGGLQKSDLLILAGRPSMGKSALATNMGMNAARAYLQSGGKEGAVVGLFSLEMSAEQLAGRILADLSGVPSDKIRRGEVKDTDFHKFVEASQQMSQAPLFIDDTAALTLSAIRTRSRRLKRQHNLGLIIIDYLQLIQGSGRGGQESRVQEVSEITRGLKALAKELDVPVLALSQLSRAVEARDNKRPQLSDLRESGSIEQDADIVMFVYREEYYLEREQPAARPEEASDKFAARHDDWLKRMEQSHNVAECIIAKQRHGPIGTVKLHFEGEFTRFGDLAHYTVEDYE